MAASLRSEAEVARLVAENEKLVDYMVNRYLKRYFVGSMEREDLRSWAMIGLVGLSVLAYLGLPGATVLVNFLLVIGTGLIAAYLVHRGVLGSQAGRVAAPSAIVFALVTLAAAISTVSSGRYGRRSFNTSNTREACCRRSASSVWRSAVLTSSGANSGSSVAEASARCISAVRRPRTVAESR